MTAEIGLADSTWLGLALEAWQSGNPAAAAAHWAAISGPGMAAIRERFGTFPSEISAIAEATSRTGQDGPQAGRDRVPGWLEEARESTNPDYLNLW